MKLPPELSDQLSPCTPLLAPPLPWRDGRDEQPSRISLGGTLAVWNDIIGDFDHNRSTALPAPLHGWFDTEPLWIDLRWPAMRTNFRCDTAASGTQSPRSPHRFTVGRRTSWRAEDVHQHRRATTLRRIAISALSALLVATVLVGLVAIQQREGAQEQTRVALSRALAAESAAQDSLQCPPS